MKVMKFGGGCLKNVDDFLNVSKIIKSEKENIAVVVSAVYGITDLLEDSARKALISEKEIDEDIQKIRKCHLKICDEGIKNENIRKMIKSEIDLKIQKLRKNLYGICYTSELTESLRANILSYGERFSTFLLSGILQDNGISSHPFEADQIGIVTDESFDNATVDLKATKENIRKHLIPLLKGRFIPVISGYFAITPSGKISLLGRNGSDYTASVIAFCTETDALEIWKDVDGFMTADPKIIENARLIEKLSYDEAAELSYFGAKILHPRTVEPISLNKIPLVVKNFKEPEKKGTTISYERNWVKDIIKSVTYNKNISILRIHGAGVGYKPGIISEIGRKLSEKKINIYSIITSQTCINLIIDRKDADEAHQSLKILEGGFIERIKKEEKMALIAVVGDGISKKEGIAGRVFSSVAREGVNIEMMSGGASDCAYYFIVKEDYVERVIKAVHSEFLEN
ncbi:MAG: aspartate kinase [Candidatus Aminicenantia bacterium]